MEFKKKYQCNNCSTAHAEMFLFLECSHFMCLKCATIKYVSDNQQILCCNIRTKLSYDTIRTFARHKQFEYARVQQLQIASKLNQNQINYTTDQQQLKLFEANVYNKTNKYNEIYDTMAQTQPQYHRKYVPKYDVINQIFKTPNFISVKTYNSNAESMIHHLDRYQQRNSSPLPRQQQVIDKEKQKSQHFGDLENILTLQLERVRKQFGYLHKQLLDQQQKTTTRLLSLYEQELKYIQKPINPIQMQKINSTLSRFVNSLDLSKTSYKINKLKMSARDHQNNYYSITPPGSLLHKLECNQSRMQQKLIKHYGSSRQYQN